MVRHRLRVDAEPESPVPLDDHALRRDLVDDAAVTRDEARLRIVRVEHDRRSDPDAGPKPCCQVTGSNGVHVTIVGRPGQVRNPPNGQDRRPERAGSTSLPSKCKPPAVGFRIQRLRTSAAGLIHSGDHACRETLESDREWEHWPGRKPPDDGIRHRLRALFAATDDEEAVDALISDRGRELEEQTERLQQTIESLERREEQAARLRSAVEEMLRHGSAELDERQAELAALAVELRAREEAVREQERDICAPQAGARSRRAPPRRGRAA